MEVHGHFRRIRNPHRRRHLRDVEDAAEVYSFTFKMQVWVVYLTDELYGVFLRVIGVGYDQLRFEELGLPVALVARVEADVDCRSFTCCEQRSPKRLV